MPGHNVVARSALALLGVYALPVCGEKQSADKEEAPFVLGNAVPRRNVPPIAGCTVQGKVYEHDTAKDYFIRRLSWDWCQDYCKNTKIPMKTGKGPMQPCATWSFFPDGKCYLQPAGADLVDSEVCSHAEPCEHGFPVVSGPVSCDKLDMWADPSTTVTTTTVTSTTVTSTAETTTAEPTTTSSTSPITTTTEATTSSSTSTREEVADAEEELRAQPGMPELPALEASGEPLAAEGHPCNDADGPRCAGALECFVGTCVNSTGGVWNPAVAPPEPPSVTVGEATAAAANGSAAVLATPSPIAPPEAPALPLMTTPAPPYGAVARGYFYEPFSMPGSGRMMAPSWQACQLLCAGVDGCAHFGYWPDGGCHLQDVNATLKLADCEETNCTGSEVLSGPRNLTDESTWPDIDSVLPKAGGETLGSPRAREAVEPEEAPAMLETSRGPGMAGVAVVMAVVLAAAGVGSFVYSRGCFGFVDFDDQDSSGASGSDEDSGDVEEGSSTREADLEVPLRPSQAQE